MRFNVITLFPEMIVEALTIGVVGEAIRSGLIELEALNPRQWTKDRHQSVDDRPFGGGDGMVMMIDPILQAIESLGEKKGRVVGLSPHGRIWDDKMARAWAVCNEPITLVSGRYAGWDYRLCQKVFDEEISLGDFVLSGGEIAALAVIDSVARHVPGTLGNKISSEIESFAEGLLEAPQFTRPEVHPLGRVPEFLLSGHHQKISEVRWAASVWLTKSRRPDLFSKLPDGDQAVEKARRTLKSLPAHDLEALGLGEVSL